jgi:hypothetical protein
MYSIVMPTGAAAGEIFKPTHQQGQNLKRANGADPLP